MGLLCAADNRSPVFGEIVRTPPGGSWRRIRGLSPAVGRPGLQATELHSLPFSGGSLQDPESQVLSPWALKTRLVKWLPFRLPAGQRASCFHSSMPGALILQHSHQALSGAGMATRYLSRQDVLAWSTQPTLEPLERPQRESYISTLPRRALLNPGCTFQMPRKLFKNLSACALPPKLSDLTLESPDMLMGSEAGKGQLQDVCVALVLRVSFKLWEGVFCPPFWRNRSSSSPVKGEAMAHFE